MAHGHKLHAIEHHEHATKHHAKHHSTHHPEHPQHGKHK
jgi:hypothetical protein